MRPEEPAPFERKELAGQPMLRGGGSANIAVELRRQILAGDYVLGERLPPERALAVQFGAARGTVREALRRLEEIKLVDRRVGSGTYVSYRTDEESDDVAAG